VASLLLYCRAGFENDCAAEIIDYAQQLNIFGYCKSVENSAYVEFIPHNPNDVEKLWRKTPLEQLIFARQILKCYGYLSDLSEEDRINPIYELVQGEHFNGVMLEYPDTNDGKSVSKFCKKFSGPLERFLNKQTAIRKKSNQRLHLMFLDSKRVYVCAALVAQSSSELMGIKRLKCSPRAPSRSALKLEEAFVTFLTNEERQRFLKACKTGVDLGAAPGGWTFILVEHNLRVSAVDNGPMQSELMATGKVEHFREDGFKFKPQRPVDWLVCDMVEKPQMVVKRMAHWFVQGWTDRAVFNLKLPMKKRFGIVSEALEDFLEELDRHNIQVELKARQLYHDREEITVYAARIKEY